MKVVRADERLSTPGTKSSGASGLDLTWWQGPTTNDELDVGIAQVDAGARTPPHTHHKGQVIVTVSGTGFIELEGERIETSAGDVVICPAGEHHVHGAAGDGQWVHLTITTGTHGGPAPSDRLD
ncbi:MAG: cupin domain-containing protein [Candidatus Nanopelagicales bacterium]